MKLDSIVNERDPGDRIVQRVTIVFLTATLTALMAACERMPDESSPVQPVRGESRSAQPAIEPAVAGQPIEFEMKPAASLTDKSAQPRIIGGTKADPAAWPATFVFRSMQGGACTSTLVGEIVAITAAHCVGNGAKGTLSHAGKQIEVTCHHHPDYKNVNSQTPGWEPLASPDFALCELSSAVPGGAFERIDAEGKNVTKGKAVHLLGFGCNQDGGSDARLGILYEGNSKVDSPPAPPSYYTTARTGAAVCFGNSGGSAYQYQNSARTRRILIGINSRGDISKISRLSTTSVPGFLSWAKNWASSRNAKICGVHADASGCRPQ